MHEIHIGLHSKIDITFITQVIEMEDSHRPRT